MNLLRMNVILNKTIFLSKYIIRSHTVISIWRHAKLGGKVTNYLFFITYIYMKWKSIDVIGKYA